MKWNQAFAISTALLAGTGLALAADEEPAAQKRPAGRGRPARILAEHDKNGDGFLEKGEMPERMLGRLQQMDANEDGKLSLDELRKFAGSAARDLPTANGSVPDGDPLLRYLDTSGDGEFSADEIAAAGERLLKLDKNDDGTLDRGELAVLSRPSGGRGGGKPGEIITPAAKGERIADKLKPGDTAPEFTLPLLSGKGAISLATLRDKRPVVLIFASYT